MKRLLLFNHFVSFSIHPSIDLVKNEKDVLAYINDKILQMNISFCTLFLFLFSFILLTILFLLRFVF